jgi:predicted acylesterase/phospholipase RssA
MIEVSIGEILDKLTILIIKADKIADETKLSGVHKFIGTSIGAIIGYLLCIGYTPIEIMVYLAKSNLMERLAKFDVLQAMHNHGAVSFSIINEVLEKMTIEKIGRLITLGELRDRFGKTLICCTFNLSSQEQEFKGSEDHPEMPCLVALRMSSNLPVLFEPFLYEHSYYVDGCVISTFPIFRVDMDKDVPLGIRFRRSSSSSSATTTTTTTTPPLVASPPTPAEKEKEESSDVLPPPPPEEKKKEKIDYAGKSLMMFLYDIMVIPSSFLQDLMNKEYYDKCHIIELDPDGMSSLNFNMNMNTRLEMFSSGYETAKNFLHSSLSS